MVSLTPFPESIIAKMDDLYHFSSSKNAEIKNKWYIFCIQCNHKAIYAPALEFVTNIGRMKFVRPIYRYFGAHYRALAKAEGGLEPARKAFTEHRDFYHPICSKMVAKDLGLDA
jgi:leukotriene-A4 hydrolase